MYTCRHLNKRFLYIDIYIRILLHYNIILCRRIQKWIEYIYVRIYHTK